MYYSDYGYYHTTNPVPFIIISIIAALAIAVLSFIFIVPRKKRNTLNKFFRVVSDVFNFKSLLLEKILKFCYIFSTFFTFIFGFFMLFMQEYGDSLALGGLLVMILGPIFIRIVYESFMMFIIVVKNVIEINKSVSGDDAADAPSFEMPEIPAAPAAPVNNPYGYNTAKVCSKCGAQVNDPDTIFCPNCGNRF